MITKDVSSYLVKNYEDYLETISNLSMSDKGRVLVEDGHKLYNYDKITEVLYPIKTPDSADAIYATDKKVFFVEYKSGFIKKINENNFDKSLMTCPDDEEKYCEPYAKLFFKKQKKETEILYHSIHMKAVESYMTLMKAIEPNCEQDDTQKILIFCVVVDDYIENMEDILSGLANKPSDTNTITSLRQSLSRFCKTEGKDYYYDEIKVLSPYEFKIFVNKNVS